MARNTSLLRYVSSVQEVNNYIKVHLDKEIDIVFLQLGEKIKCNTCLQQQYKQVNK